MSSISLFDNQVLSIRTKNPGYDVTNTSIPVDAMKSEILDLIEQDKKLGRVLVTDNSYRPRNVLRCKTVYDFVLRPDLMETMTRIFNGVRPVLSSVGANSLQPGAPGMSDHVDYPYFAQTPMLDSPTPLCVQVILSLDGMNSENGATHFNGDRAYCMPGGLIIAHGGVVHGVDPNKSPEARTNLLVSFSPYWVRPFNDLITGRTPEELTPEFRKLVGMDFADRVAGDLSHLEYGARRRKV